MQTHIRKSILFILNLVHFFLHKYIYENPFYLINALLQFLSGIFEQVFIKALRSTILQF